MNLIKGKLAEQNLTKIPFSVLLTKSFLCEIVNSIITNEQLCLLLLLFLYSKKIFMIHQHNNRDEGFNFYYI